MVIKTGNCFALNFKIKMSITMCLTNVIVIVFWIYECYLHMFNDRPSKFILLLVSHCLLCKLCNDQLEICLCQLYVYVLQSFVVNISCTNQEERD